MSMDVTEMISVCVCVCVSLYVCVCVCVYLQLPSTELGNLPHLRSS